MAEAQAEAVAALVAAVALAEAAVVAAVADNYMKLSKTKYDYEKKYIVTGSHCGRDYSYSRRTKRGRRNADKPA